MIVKIMMSLNFNFFNNDELAMLIAAQN